jgi:hypothetical protein
MNKLFSAVILVIIMAFPLVSQAQGENSSWISLDAGFNSYWILNQNTYGNQELPYRPKLNISGTATFKYLFDDFGYSIGVGIGNMGQNYAGEMAGNASQRKVNLTYFQVPLLAMYSLGGNRQEMWVSFGPQIMYLLSADQYFERSAGGREIANPEMLLLGNTNIKERFKPLDVMLKLELTEIYALGSSDKFKALVSLKGALGLTDINSKDFQIENIHNKYAGSHNFYVGIHLGILYNLKVKAHYMLKSSNRKHFITPFNR